MSAFNLQIVYLDPSYNDDDCSYKDDDGPGAHKL